MVYIMPKSTTVRKTTSVTVRKTKVIKSHKKSKKSAKPRKEMFALRT